MNTPRTHFARLACRGLAAVLTGLFADANQTTAITYQGKLVRESIQKNWNESD